MNKHTLEVARRGIQAAVVASVPQVLLPKLEERLFLRDDEDADLGPRLIEALAKKAKEPLPEDRKWLAASTFHFGYSAFWGTLYALAYERKPVHPLVGGLALGTVIHVLTFSRWGGAVVAGVEEEPRKRPWRIEAMLATAPLVFGLGTALLYGRGPTRTVRERVKHEWRKRT